MTEMGDLRIPHLLNSKSADGYGSSTFRTSTIHPLLPLGDTVCASYVHCHRSAEDPHSPEGV
ncbi:hypothetical protein SynA15127_00361 [Synechococcus sp. A15-127]|nr:hypothetical protein SynA15127_00361 [Synechococcus sp. A15-127]